MSGLFNVGTRALQANQIALQTAGNNIANVNTPGYSRQTVVLQTAQGQYTGAGYIGKGVDVATIQRNFSAFLTRQSALAGATSSADNTRADKLKQLEGIFGGGSTGLGAAVNDMLNAFSDVASAPTDLTARTVVLTRVDETAARMRASSQSLDDLQQGVTQELSQKATAINSLAKSIAGVNEQIARAQGSGQPPNDLLDQRDQLVRELNQYVQTTSIAADDGTVGIFLGGSQALVLGTTASTVSLVKDDFGDPLKSKLAINSNGQSTTLDENTLGGGEVSGLLRFQNTDLAEGRNLLGRLTMVVSTAMNTQHGLGLDLDGNKGGNLFTPTTFTDKNVLVPVAPAVVNSTGSSLTLSISDASKLVASDYEVNFASSSTGTITRRSDGMVTTFALPTLPALPEVTIDGLKISMTGTTGDRFLLKPFSTSASTISSVFSTPRSLAVASPVAGSMGTTNTGSLQQVTVLARSNPALVTPVKLTFTGANSYTRSDEIPANTTAFTYTPGQAIEANFPATPLTSPPTYATPLVGWSVTLQGSPKAGDTFTVVPLDTSSIADIKLNAGNAGAMMNLRDAKMIDGGPLTDGYAGLIAQIGIRAQSANFAAEVSGSIASNLERDRTGVSGVNLDEEAAKLLQFQQAYQASSKMIQISQSIFDTLIQTLSR
jgi:flagellar hook-associated protein 1 FlgK